MLFARNNTCEGIGASIKAFRRALLPLGAQIFGVEASIGAPDHLRASIGM